MGQTRLKMLNLCRHYGGNRQTGLKPRKVEDFCLVRDTLLLHPLGYNADKVPFN
jgi:hypothetical protein